MPAFALGIISFIGKYGPAAFAQAKKPRDKNQGLTV